MTRWRIAIAVQGRAPVWLDHRVTLPPLPNQSGISAPRCSSAVPHGAGGIAAVWHGRVYVVAGNGTYVCRLTADIDARNARLSPNGRWVTWQAPDRTRRWIEDLWVSGTNGESRAQPIPNASISISYWRGILWSPGGKRFAYVRGGLSYVVNPGRAMPVPLTVPGQRLSGPLSWLANGSAIVVQTGPKGMWAHEIDLALNRVQGQSRTLAIRFPSWLNDPKGRPIGSRVLPVAVASADGQHVFLATSGGGVRISGIWDASLGTRTPETPAHLVIGAPARVRGARTPAARLDGATHVFGSPDGRYVVVDPTRGFWVEDTQTFRGHLVPIPAQRHCVVSQSAWMGGSRAIGFVQTCRLMGGFGFRSTLFRVNVTGGTLRRLLSVVDVLPDAISIGTVYRCVGCGFTPGM